MKKTKNPSTAFTSFCHKLAVLLAALLIGLFCSWFNPSKAQPAEPSVHAMVRNQPFPFATGVAMDTMLYASVRAKLKAAERLRVSSEASISTLQQEIAATKDALAKQTTLGNYDAGKAAGLAARLNILDADLFDAQTKLNQALQATEQVLSVLPRAQRKLLANATPEQIAKAVVDYIRTLQLRKWIWSGVTGAIGFVIGLALPFLL